MAYNMKGWSGYQSSLNKDVVRDEDKTNVKLSEHEKKKGTRVTGGNKTEEINDLEDRIEFLQSDLDGGGKEDLKVMQKGKIITQITKLKAQLRKIKSKQ
tara:strand:+ start:1038 stop:1334 length:297 start_codon:yes stop_codon:yes gene_type:complete